MIYKIQTFYFQYQLKINFDTRKFLIDTENKKFGFYISSYDRYKYTLFIDLIYDKMDALSLDHTIVVEPNSFKDEVFKEFKSYTNDIYPCEIYNFSDLNRVELFDKSRTDENRIYTIQDKSGDALWGAIGGSLLSKTRFNEYATAGAIIGASGERKITENVKRDTHIEFCVTLYLNDIKHPYESFSVKNENKLHEFIGALEYIKNNK